MGHSLRGRLLAWVMLPLAGAVVLAGVVSRQNAEATAGQSIDFFFVIRSAEKLPSKTTGLGHPVRRSLRSSCWILRSAQNDKNSFPK